ncbi:MAG: bifunctional enoyl-CoA hydratase/phosphate acetyltransferase, partial [Pseudomonadota bacterium]
GDVSMTTENRPFDALEVGESAELAHLVTADDLFVFANASGNRNPMHLPGAGREEPVAPSQWVASLVSAVIGNRLPGPGTLYLSQRFDFVGRAHAGDTLTARVEVAEKRGEARVLLKATVVDQDDETILTGEALVAAPTEPMRMQDVALPGLVLERHVHFEALMARTEGIPAIPVAVACPEDEASLGGALLARDKGLIDPVLVGRPDKIRAAAEAIGADLAGLEILEAERHGAAARLAVKTVAEGKADALMKGALHTDDLLRAVLSKSDGLRAGRRLTHVFVLDVPGIGHPVFVTDAAINIAPDLTAKVDIVQNAIDLAISLGIEQPKVGVLSAVETVNPNLPSSVDAALLSKMAERGQITGGVVEGPLAMDNAVSLAAARAKGISGPVAGQAEILVAPDLDAGNMLAKQLTFVARAAAAGVVLGARCPIILTSRADDERARLASCAVAALHAARLRALI